MLDRQLFGDACTLAVPLGDPAAAVRDGTTWSLATMLRGQDALLRAAMQEAGVAL